MYNKLIAAGKTVEVYFTNVYVCITKRCCVHSTACVLKRNCILTLVIHYIENLQMRVAHVSVVCLKMSRLPIGSIHALTYSVATRRGVALPRNDNFLGAGGYAAAGHAQQIHTGRICRRIDGCNVAGFRRDTRPCVSTRVTCIHLPPEHVV